MGLFWSQSALDLAPRYATVWGHLDLSASCYPEFVRSGEAGKKFQRKGGGGPGGTSRGARVARRCSAEHPLVGRDVFGDDAGGFLRRKSKQVRGVGYSYWHLCETVRTARGPRQRVVASLGKLDEGQVAGLRGRWEDLPALLRGEPPARAARCDPLPGLASAVDLSPPPAQWEQVEVRGVRVERSRDFGESYLALALWHRLRLDELLAELLPAGRRGDHWRRGLTRCAGPRRRPADLQRPGGQPESAPAKGRVSVADDQLR